MRVRKDPSAAGPWLYLLLLLVSSCWSDFLSFEPGVEYAYRIQTVSEVSRVNEPFHIGAQHFLVNVPFLITAIQSEEHDHSKWFSFEISGRGEIAHVWYPPSEVPDVVNTKKGILGFFSARLHHNHEVGKPGEESWTYVTNETGHEGHHMSTYSVEPHASGFKVTKVREGHPAMGTDSESRMEKHMYFNTGKKIPHRVFIREKVSTPRKDQPGFNIHKGTRGGSFVNEQQEVDLPEMSSSAESEFILIGLSEASPVAPPANLKRDVIFITKVSKRFGPAANMTEQKAPIRQDLACLRRLALRNASPSKQVIGCFTHLRDTLGSLSEGDLESVVQHYFNMPDMPTRQLDKQNLINAVASFHTDFSDRLVVENVLLSPRPNKDIIEHVLPNFVGIDQPPSKLLVSTLEDLAFYPDDFDEVYLDPSVRQTCLLVLGSLANVVSAHGDRKTTQRVVGRIEDKLGLHDPWLERQKRSIKTAEELERHDFERVTLLEALGNAAQPSSYEHILSYTNHSLAPPLLRRSGLHALRKYHNQQTVMQYSVQPDIVVGTETWLDSSVGSSEVFPDTLNMFRRDRAGRGGDVLVAVKNYIIATHHPEPECPCELTWVQVQLANRDFNLPDATWNPEANTIAPNPSSLTGKYISLANDCGLEQMEKADALGAQFESVFTREDKSTVPTLGESVVPTIPSLNISVEGVAKQLHSLNPSKSTGPDGMPPRLLKTVAEQIAPILQTIFSQSISTGDVPEDWRTANIAPIFKKGDRTMPSNYRPVSLTSVCGKVLEHIVHSHMMRHLDTHGVLSPAQHGFRKGLSCESQLVLTLQDLANNLDHNKQVDVAVLDFSKAFDTVPHERLL
ncbi:Hypp6492 [Branchiostoma lanceolatum]|uniref:Hypp6492 protein n=1 Tax=Branchiostoma lanceolatum TaxID=7740 RepID=A0A8J9YUZ1_BRALA|nr:Hypp6492 [Branchiostoma lanceolatum]